MDFRLLGPLEVVGDGGVALSIGTGRQRALLALLLLRANELVATDRLVEELWGESPPPTAQRMLHNQVSTLRRALGQNGRLETHGSAYRLSVAPGERDVDRFEELVASGRANIETDPEAAAEKFREALALWRGPALSDLVYEQFAQTEIARLEERRWAAFEARVEAELALGRHADLVSELEAAVAEQPLREHLHGQLMLALYRCGRQAEALEAYRRARRTLVDEVGVEPGTELRDLQDAILAQDPSLDAPAGVEELPPALDGGSPILAGRDRELAELSALLADACEGRGTVVALSGPRGSGKTRLAAELAREALRRRMAVVYAGAGDATADALGGIGRAEETAGPVLLVLDDADYIRPEVLDRAAAVGASIAGRRLLLVVIHASPEPPAAFAAEAVRSIELGALDEQAMAEIARLYDAAGVEPLPTAAERDGLPLAVHRAAAELARARASRAAGASAGRAAAERHQLRAAEADLSGDLLALRTVDQQGRLYEGEADGAPLPAVCPFLGLATFHAAHAEYFFGRERLVAELVARLVGAPLLAVVGRSGSGKSSAVRAGLLPALASGVLPGSEGWAQAVMRPGAHPMAELERALPEHTRETLLVVDQFEEVFTVCRDEGERAEFLDALVTHAADRDRRVQMVIAIRADFYGHCGAYDRLARLVGANQVLVGPMRRDELRRAIVEPARRVGLRVEPSLTDALIADVLDEPGGLPLLSAALLEQWRERDGHVMRRAAYERTGGVRGAVGRLAEATYARLSDQERVAAKRILLRLADAGEQGATFVRRPVSLDELDPGGDGQTGAALELLADSRLVTVDEGTVEVAHEALLREWPRLRTWLEEDAEGRRLHQHLIHAARDWDAVGRDPGELYRGARLASALDWTAEHDGELNALERHFLDESRATAELEAERQRAANRRLRTLLAGLAVLLVLAVVTGVVALNQRGEARDSALSADAQRLGAEALAQDRFDRALLLARAGVSLDETPTTQGSLLSVLLRSPAALGILDFGRPVGSAALSPDGRLMAIGDVRGKVTLYRTETRQPVGRPYSISGGHIQSLRFSPDGGSLAIGSVDPTDPGQSAVVDLLDPRTRKLRTRVELPPFRERAAFVQARVEFLPNGRDMVVASVHGSFPDGPPTILYRVDGDTGAIGRELRVGGYSGRELSITADGERVFLTSPRENRSWEIDPERLELVRTYRVGDFAGAVSPDGQVFALGSQRGRVRLLDLRSGEVRTLRGRHDGGVQRMTFTPDAHRLVTAGNAQVTVWDVSRGAIAERLGGHSGSIWGLDTSTDGRTGLTAAYDGRAILWDLAGDRRLDRRFSVRGYRDDLDVWYVVDVARGMAVSPDSRTLAITHIDGTVELLDTETLRRRRAFRAIRGFAGSVGFSPDGRLLAVAGAAGRVTLRNARTGASAGELRGLRADTQALAFSPGGGMLAAAEAGYPPPRMQIWDVRRRAPTRFAASAPAGALAFSPDETFIAAANGWEGADGAEIRDVRSGKQVKWLETPEPTRSVAFSRDGSVLVVGLFDGTVRFYSTDGWKMVGSPFEAHAGIVMSTVFSPDGRVLATAGADGTVALWDVHTRKPIGTPVTVAPDKMITAAFSPDGAYVFAVSTSGDGIRLDASPESWKRRACGVAGRDLTAREWEGALPDRPYRAVCSDD